MSIVLILSEAIKYNTNWKNTDSIRVESELADSVQLLEYLINEKEYTNLDFKENTLEENQLTGTIDYSPNPSAKDMTIHLDDEDLEGAQYSQFERFIRVWIVDRKLYAPNLHMLKIIFHAKNQKPQNIVGVTKFLQYLNEVQYDTSYTILSIHYDRIAL